MREAPLPRGAEGLDVSKAEELSPVDGPRRYAQAPSISRHAKSALGSAR